MVQPTSSLRRLLLASAIAALALLPILAAAPAQAVENPSPTPPSSTAPGTPSISSPASGTVVTGFPLTVTGTKAAGSSIQLLAGSPRDAVCIVPADDRIDYSCPVNALPNGEVGMTAVQLIDGQSSESARIRLAVVGPPAFSAASPLLTSGLITGTAVPGATVTISASGGPSWTAPANDSGYWTSVIPRSLASGSYSLTATQTTPSGGDQSSSASAPLQVELDGDAPAAPTIASPTPGSSVSVDGTSYTGSGEDEATVSVFAGLSSGAEVLVCDAMVSGGRWSCSGGGVPVGTATIIAIQRDAAGNTGAGSAAVVLRVTTPVPGSQNPPPSPGRSDRPSEHAPAVPPASPPSASPNPSGPPSAGEHHAAPPPDWWTDRTPFTTSVPPPLRPSAEFLWWRAVILAFAVILLVLIPLRLLASSLPRLPLRLARLTGRNRVPTHDDQAPELRTPRTATVVATLAAAAALVMFANPVNGQPVYLRLLAAAAAAVCLINLAGIVAPRFLASRLGLPRPEIALAPKALLLVGVGVILSRLLDLSPAFLFTVMFSLTVTAGSRSARGAVALSRIGALLGVGLLGWLGSALIGEPSGLLPSFGAELSNVLALGGIGSAAVLLVPLGRLDGRMVLRWSRPIWAASALLVLTALFGLLGPAIDRWENWGPAIGVGASLLLFGAVGISVWLWQRVIQPILAQT